MKKFLMIVLVLLAAFLVYKYAFKKDELPKDKPKPLTVSKHSEAFNRSADSLLAAYYRLTDGFVQWAADSVQHSAVDVQLALDAFAVDDLKKDSVIYQTVLFPWENAKTNVKTIREAADWNEKRRALQDLSDNLRMILQTVMYDRAVVYWQECPMAFGEGQPGYWLSAGEAVVNPYLGNKDPKYGNSMLNCGETKMKIDFTKGDSTLVD